MENKSFYLGPLRHYVIAKLDSRALFRAGGHVFFGFHYEWASFMRFIHRSFDSSVGRAVDCSNVGQDLGPSVAKSTGHWFESCSKESPLLLIF